MMGIENPMYYCPPDEDPECEVPGIDDCDHLYCCSDGNRTVYIRVQESEYEPGLFYAEISLDDESDCYSESLPEIHGPFDTPDDACRKLKLHYDWVTNGEMCSNSLRAFSLENDQ